jgi:Tfp pilus assembly protein PilN
MRKVRIDFAPPGLVRSVLRTPRQAWGVVLMAISIACALGVASLGLRQREWETAQMRALLRAQSQVRPAMAAPTGVRPPVPEAQAAAVNTAVLQLNLPWRALRDAVQASTPANIALLALEPDAKRSSVRITAETKSSDDMIAYVEQLQKLEWFSSVTLARHEINEQDPNRPLRFQLDAQWRSTQ